MIEEIRVLVPGPGRCRVCGARHGKDQGHEIRSLFYLAMFWRENRRFPTREDAENVKREV